MKLAAIVLLAAAAPLAAQSADRDAAFRDAVSVPFSAVATPAAADTAKVVTAAPAKPESCGEPGAALEAQSFLLTVPNAAAPINLAYAGCAWEGRNDYLSGYTERYYKGSGGYGLTLVTNHGDGAYPAPNEDESSDVLVSKGKDWVGRLGSRDNQSLITGKAASADGYTLKAPQPSVPACEAHLPKVIYGGSELWLLTKTKAYYYHEDCDICAELDSCDVNTGVFKEEIVAHSVSCSDLNQYKKGGDVVYEACPQ